MFLSVAINFSILILTFVFISLSFHSSTQSQLSKWEVTIQEEMSKLSTNIEQMFVYTKILPWEMYTESTQSDLLWSSLCAVVWKTKKKKEFWSDVKIHLLVWLSCLADVPGTGMLAKHGLLQHRFRDASLHQSVSGRGEPGRSSHCHLWRWRAQGRPGNREGL